MTNGNIKVVEPVDDYKKIHKSIIKNKNIDCTTLGIYVKIVVLGAEWQLNIKGLASVLDLSDAKVRKSIGVLEREGYIKRIANHHNGKLDGWIYEVYPMPLDEMQRSNAGYAKMDGELDFQSCAECSVTENQTTLKSDNTENGEDNNNRLNILLDLKNNKTYNIKEEKELKEKFASFMSLYHKLTGKRNRGLNTEFNAFKSKHKDWKSVIPYLSIAIKRETKEREHAKMLHKFFPEPKMLSTYLGKERAWELYVTVGEDAEQIESTYTPQGRTIWFNEDTKSYWSLDNFYDERIYDGYDDDNRPDGAEITLNNGRGTYKWDSNCKKWIKK